MHWIDWLIVLSLNGAIIGYGMYLARRTKTSSDWFLGERALPWWAIGLSMFATNVDNADLVSVTGQTYRQGLHILTVYAIGSSLGGILASYLVVPAMYRAGHYTNAEYLESRFGVWARVLSALIQIQYRTSMLGLILWSQFLLLTELRIVGPVAAWLLIACLALLAGIYTSWGGLKSVVWTDALQSGLMVLGGIVIFVSLWQSVGGWSGMRERLAELDAADGGSRTDLLHIGRFDGGSEPHPYDFSWNGETVRLGPWIVMMGWTIVGSGYWTVNHTQTMRLMGARSLWDMRMAATLGVGLSLPLMIACASMGVFGRAIPATSALEEPDKLYPMLARDFLGVGLKGLVVAGVVAAAISTFDSMGSALSAIFTRDVYARLISRDGDDGHYVIVGRIATIVVILLGFAYLPFIWLQKSMIDAFTTLIPVFVTPLFVMYILGAATRVNRRSGLVGLLVGGMYGLFALYCREAIKVDWLPNVDRVPLWLTDRWGAFGWSALITTATMWLVTLCMGREASRLPVEVKHHGWLERSRESLPQLREHPFRTAVPWWGDSRIYAIVLFAGTCYVVFILFW